MGNLFGQPTGLSREVCLFAGADWLQLIITSEGGERPIVFCVLVKWNEPVSVSGLRRRVGVVLLGRFVLSPMWWLSFRDRILKELSF